MNNLLLIYCLGIGVVAGLRSMTAPAIVSWAVYIGWLNVASGPFSLAGSLALVVLLTAWALVELVLDKTSKIGKRTELVGLIFRVITSSLCGAVVSSTVGLGMAAGTIAGIVGGMIGTFGGYHLRRICVLRTSSGDLPFALAEDVIAISLGVACVYLVSH